ncbi:MAG: FHA domain-containing protein [Bacillota bacterium]
MLNLARKLKAWIFTNDNGDSFGTQETIDNETKVFKKQELKNPDFSAEDSTIIREPIGRKKASLKRLVDGQPYQNIVLDSIETNIGRQNSNEIVIKDKSVSRVHAQLINKKYYYKIRDLSSTNGLYINGELVQEQKLSAGDKIRLGETILEFSLAE